MEKTLVMDWDDFDLEIDEFSAFEDDLHAKLRRGEITRAQYMTAINDYHVCESVTPANGCGAYCRICGETLA